MVVKRHPTFFILLALRTCTAKHHSSPPMLVQVRLKSETLTSNPPTTRSSNIYQQLDNVILRLLLLRLRQRLGQLRRHLCHRRFLRQQTQNLDPQPTNEQSPSLHPQSQSLCWQNTNDVQIAHGTKKTTSNVFRRLGNGHGQRVWGLLL